MEVAASASGELVKPHALTIAFIDLLPGAIGGLPVVIRAFFLACLLEFLGLLLLGGHLAG